MEHAHTSDSTLVRKKPLVHFKNNTTIPFTTAFTHIYIFVQISQLLSFKCKSRRTTLTQFKREEDVIRVKLLWQSDK